ncbi:PAS domain S-box-containing protein [Saccharicrinis carchari]|uniref:histidine kinase n=1 Tax=Saccharicrinis carchari TaxID=1168039 RepID=A0A521EU45_SACCC|nr:PAS domain S-box protein [Saccharicrinis carchari]SMO87417.1 PAS domain S-box-containing protein [Saccharicrinis carchari]
MPISKNSAYRKAKRKQRQRYALLCGKIKQKNKVLQASRRVLNAHSVGPKSEADHRMIRKKQVITSQHLYKSLFNNLPEAFGLYELVFNEDKEPVDYIIRDVNSRLLQLYNLSRDELIDKKGNEIFAHCAYEWRQMFAEVALSGGVKKYVEYVEKLDKYYELHAYSPQLNFFAVVYNDITESEKAKAALLVQKNRTEGILRGTNAGTWDWNIQSNEFFVNERWAQILGYTIDELEPISEAMVYDFFASEDKVRVKEIMERVFAKELDYFDVESRQKHKKGHFVWVHSKGSVVEWDEDGKPLRMMGTYLDVSDKKETALALADSEKRFKKVFDKSKAVMYIVDPETTEIIDVNDTAVKFYGYSRESLLGMSMDQINVLSREEIAAKMKLAKQEEQSVFRFEHRLASGHIRNVNVIASLIKVNNQAFLHSIALDTTKAIKAEYKIKQINKRLVGLDNIIHYKASSINDLLDFTLKQSIEFTNSDLGAVYHCDIEKGLFYLNNWSQNVQLTHPYASQSQHVDNMDCLNKALQLRRAVIENKPTQYYPFQKSENLKDELLKSITLPVIANNKVVALFWLATQNNSYTKFHAEQLMLLLDTAWIMVEKQRMKG